MRRIDLDQVVAIRQALQTMDACLVSDALDSLGADGAATGLLPVWEGAFIAGRVVTMRLVPVTADSPPSRVHLGARAIEAAAPGDVIVVDNGGRSDMGSWGGLLSLAAIERGIAGVVTDGACRDVDEARAAGFPVFARSGAARTARGRVYEESFGEPVQIAGVAVRPGDFVIADGSGVVVVSQELAEDVIRVATELQAKERRMAAALKEGVPVSQVLNGEYEAMLNDRG